MHGMYPERSSLEIHKILWQCISTPYEQCKAVALVLNTGVLTDRGRVDVALICLRNPCPHVT